MRLEWAFRYDILNSNSNRFWKFIFIEKPARLIDWMLKRMCLFVWSRPLEFKTNIFSLAIQLVISSSICQFSWAASTLHNEFSRTLMWRHIRRRSSHFRRTRELPSNSIERFVRIRRKSGRNLVVSSIRFDVRHNKWFQSFLWNAIYNNIIISSNWLKV